MNLGVIGGGQLARMMVEAATPLGIRLAVLAEGADVSAAQITPTASVGDFTDPDAVLAFARGLDAVTFDHEHVPAAVLKAVAQQVSPSGPALPPSPTRPTSS